MATEDAHQALTLREVFHLDAASCTQDVITNASYRRNEVVAKVIFLHLSVILFTGGDSASVHAGIPPREQTPRDQTPPGPPGTDPPGSRHPPGKQTPAYGLRAAGTHPTGINSC